MEPAGILPADLTETQFNKISALAKELAGIDPDQHVFLNRDGRSWRNNLLKRFKSCVKAAELDPTGLDIHNLRQTCGTILASDPTNDVRTVMSLMRHASISMTMNLYGKPRAMRQRDAMKTLLLSTRGKLRANRRGCNSSAMR